MANAYVGNPYALVFPVDCDGFLKIPYSTHSDITEPDLWSHGAGFTVEAVITPYDVNGNSQTGKGKVQENTGPSGIYSNGITNRYTQKMMLFSNSSFQFYLENQTALPDGVTTTSAPVNQPAEYRLAAKVGSTTLNSPVVIKPVSTLHGYYDVKGFYNGMRTSLTEISTNASHSPPTRVITIDNNNFTNETNIAFVAATGDVTFSTGTSNAPESYYPAQQATASITFNNNNFAVDVSPVAGTGTIEFHSALNTVTSNSSSRYIEVESEDGNTTTRWFPIDSSTNNVDLHAADSDVWSSGDRGFSATDGSGNTLSRQAQAKQFSDAVNAWNTGWAGSTAVGLAALNQDDIVTFTAAIRGTSPNRLGTGGALSLGSGLSNSDIEITDMSGGVDEVVHTEFITINTGSGDKKYRIFNSGLAGSIQTSSSVSYITFRKGTTLTGTMSSLVDAINHSNGNTEVTATTLSNNGVTLTVDAAGTAGNSLATPTTTNMSFVNAISGFSGGEAANETDKHIQLVDADGTTVKFLAAHPTKSTNSTGSTITLNNVQYVIYRLPTSGSNRANFADAVNNASNLDINAVDDGSNGNRVNLTQAASGTSGNTTITLANSISNVTANSFTGGAGANPDVAIDITNASGNTVRYKPSVNENTGTSDTTYTFFQKGGDAAATATNLASAINSAQGTTVSATPSSNTVTIAMLTAGSSYDVTENSSSVSLDSGFTTSENQISVDLDQTGLLGVGNKIYDSNGVLVSTVSGINGTTITLNDNITSITSTIYKEQPKETLYVNNLYKVSCVLEKNGKLKLFLNNAIVAETTISSFTFDMTNEDCFIGQDGTNINTQFMGELYEISMRKGTSASPSLHTLDPGYSDIIFYYRFGDE